MAVKPIELRLGGLRAVFGAVAAVLLVTLIVVFVLGNQVFRAIDDRSRHEQLVQDLQETFSTLQDAETGQRGYLLAENDAYLDPYRDALDAAAGRLRDLRRARNAGTISPDLADRFEELAAQKLDELSATITIAQTDGFPAAVRKVRTDAGRKIMDQLREVYAAIRIQEQRRLGEINRQIVRLTEARSGSFAATILLNLGFLAWVYRRIHREMARRYVADLETQRQRDILAVSLASIGDAVIITDTDARITFLNDIAEELTGWPRKDAIGKSCAKVFRIINESSRAPVESPVEIVLRTGKIVGLANHTLLVRRDGTEIPIDDSGAPIREPDGAVRGVILVFRDFSEYKRAEQEQRQLRERLEVANRAKDNFLAALSHELRTPLTPVLATLSAWEAGGDAPPELTDDIRMLTRNVRLEVRLIDDLLDLTRIARGQMTVRKEEVDVHVLLTAVVEIFRGELDRRQIRLGIRNVARRSWVEGDPARLQQVFWNVLGNAVKFTPDGGRIEIVTTNGEGDLRVTIADNGRGMSEETIRNLFQPFERSAARSGYQSGGLGIGLTISQNLILAHGGTIEVKSGGLGLGSTLTIRIPTGEAGAEASPAQGAAPVAALPFAALTILLVEDHLDSATVISRILRSFGHSVDVVHNVASALAQVGVGTYDLVITDIGLPDGSGVDFLMEARKFCATPMIALTGYGMEDDVTRYREAGFFQQLTKPIRFDQLEKLLRDFADGRNSPAIRNGPAEV